MIEDQTYFDEVKSVFEEHLSKYIKRQHWNIHSEIREIHKYLDFYINSMPVFSEKGTPSPPSGVDWKNNLYCVLKNEYGYTQSEIMNMNMRRVYDEWVTFAAKNGCITVKTKQQLEKETAAKEFVEKVRSGEIKLEGLNK